MRRGGEHIIRAVQEEEKGSIHTIGCDGSVSYKHMSWLAVGMDGEPTSTWTEYVWCTINAQFLPCYNTHTHTHAHAHKPTRTHTHTHTRTRTCTHTTPRREHCIFCSMYVYGGKSKESTYTFISIPLYLSIFKSWA